MVSLGVMFSYSLGLVKYRYPVFESEEELRNIVYFMLRKLGYHVLVEVPWGKYRFDLLARKDNEELVVETKNPKHSTNRIAGLAVNQLVTYIATRPKARGLLILGKPVTSHILKYMPALMDRNHYRIKNRRISVGFPIVDNRSNIHLFIVENGTTWAKGRTLISLSVTELPKNVRIREIVLSAAQFFDLIFYTLWLQNIHEWKTIGLDKHLIKLLINEARKRGYIILDNGSIKEPWYYGEVIASER